MKIRQNTMAMWMYMRGMQMPSVLMSFFAD